MKRVIFSLIFTLTLWSFTPPCGKVPELNEQMLSYVKSTINKKVGRGECWDLAAEGLNRIGATWDKKFGFGKVVDPQKDCIFPGDIIQFEGVEIIYESKGAMYSESMEHHTAIVFEVKGKGKFTIAQQNTGFNGRKVSTDPLELKNIKKGTYTFYRPVK